MLDFDEFTELAKEKIGEYLPDVNIEEIRIARVKKVNMELTGMVIIREGESTSPNIYLDGFYEDYRNGNDIDSIMNNIADTYNESYLNIPKISMVNNFSNREYILNNVYLTLVNKGQNEEIFAEAPHLDIEGMPDLAGIYRVRVNDFNDGQIASFRLNNFNLEQAGISTAELEAVALENTKRMFPPVMDDLSAVLKKKSQDAEGVFLPAGEENKLFYISNEDNINGATAILYKDELAAFAESIGENLILLPSSVHEFVAVPDNGAIETDYLADLVHGVNMNMLNLQERLSNNVFHFNKDTMEYSQLTHIDRKLDMEEDLLEKAM